MTDIDAGTSTSDSSRPCVIGVVDDDDGVLTSLRSLLESADYDVQLFSSARALLESARLAEIDCLISDIDMPVMDGFELLKSLRASRPELPIILITGHPEMLLRLPAIDPGRLFKKPFSGQKLLEAVSNALENSQK